MGSFHDLALAIRAATPRLGKTRLVTVDGPSGSGKTTFARRLVAALSQLGPVGLVELEELYDGWTLEGSWDRLDRYVLEPIAAGWAGGFHPYDWATGMWSPAWRTVPVTDVLVVEGCGSSPRAVDRFASTRVWVDSPRQTAARRGLARPGLDLDRRLRAWRQLERAHFAEQQTRSRADLRVDGDPVALSTDDPERNFRLLT